MYHNIGSIYNGRVYSFIALLGILRSNQIKSTKTQSELLTDKCQKGIKIVKHPYNCVLNKNESAIIPSYSFLIKWYARFLVFSYKHIYPLFYLCSHLRLNKFEDSDIAIRVFCSIIPRNQKLLCLPRSVFAATTSKKFKKSGVMFIGVFHPSRHMHAWIIEDKQNPCWFDHIWINFTPVTVMR